MAVQTDLDICNLAIDRVGGERIEAIGEDTPLGEFCARSYAAKRDLLLGMYRWVHASRIAPLAQRTTAPPNCPYTYAFNMPQDVIGAIHDYRDGARYDANKVSVVQQDGYLASDAAVVFAEYTATKPPADWPVWFRELVVVAFAADVAALCQNQGLADRLNQQAFGTPDQQGEGGLFLTAKIADARNAPQRTMQYAGFGGLVEARYNNPGAPRLCANGFILLGN